MANFIKRAALAFGRFTGLGPKAEAAVIAEDQFSDVPPIAGEIIEAPQPVATDIDAEIDASLFATDEIEAVAASDIDPSITAELAITEEAVTDSKLELAAETAQSDLAAVIESAVSAIDEETTAATAAFVEAPATPWTDVLSQAEESAVPAAAAATPLFAEIVISAGAIDEAPVVTVAAVEEPAAILPEPIVSDLAACGLAAPELPELPLIAIATETPAPAEEPVVVVAKVEAPVAEEPKAPIEMKPTPAAPQPAEQGLGLVQLYDLISNESSKRTDSAIAVYERLLSATRQELDATRGNNRIAWSVGGVMTAVAALGAVWAASEVSASRVELGALKQQVATGQQASIERDQLRNDLIKTREASARLEIDALKSRLDQALTVSTDRDRLKGELELARKAKQETEVELKIARAAAATQPVSYAQPAASKVFADRTIAAAAAAAASAVATKPATVKPTAADPVNGVERPDVWSILLNGRD